ncbi:MAG: hypothetical protein ONB46_13230 [candidate division KSB1 bacterium]|nr:hypothetical protein [candidate division KSB1 bacterium]MDZ7366715.1 hypothetical protein [candidate division KSB1 bacterium]MDZ7404728.1 hypothetical protein [candidate division KSB1 bacterium]
MTIKPSLSFVSRLSYKPEAARRGFRETLQRNLADENPGIRAKAVRSLVKLAQHGHLNGEERARLNVTLNRLLGNDDHFEWDRACVVRKEAQQALKYVQIRRLL